MRRLPRSLSRWLRAQHQNANAKLFKDTHLNDGLDTIDFGVLNRHSELLLVKGLLRGLGISHRFQERPTFLEESEKLILHSKRAIRLTVFSSHDDTYGNLF